MVDAPNRRPPNEIVRCRVCGRAANPILWSARDRTAWFCTIACRDAFTRAPETPGEAPELSVVDECVQVLRKLKPNEKI